MARAVETPSRGDSPAAREDPKMNRVILLPIAVGLLVGGCSTLPANPCGELVRSGDRCVCPEGTVLVDDWTCEREDGSLITAPDAPLDGGPTDSAAPDSHVVEPMMDGGAADVPENPTEPVCDGARAPENGSVSSPTAPLLGVITYACDAGFSMQGLGFAQCQADGTFDNPPPTCVPSPCSPALTAPQRGRVSRTTGVTGDVATYSCDGGFALIGDVMRTCLPAGTWSGSTPRCERVYDDCSTGRWCRVDPAPSPNGLNAVWGSSPTDVWAVGGTAGVSTIVRWDGTDWSLVPTSAPQVLTGISGTSSTDIWAVGRGGTILRWNGSTWASVPSGTTEVLNAVWASSPSDAWAVGQNGVIRRWNGTSWNTSSSGTTQPLRAVWGTSASNVWAAGDQGTMLRWNGSSWSVVPSGTISPVYGLWGSTANDVWAVGGRNIHRWNGSSWADVAIPPASSSFTQVHGSSSNNVWATTLSSVMFRWSGSSWTQVTPGSATLRGVWVASATDAWAVGGDGTILRHRP